jgi:general stress protein 26
MTSLVEDIKQQQKVPLTFQGDCQAPAVAGKVRQSKAARKSQ